MTSSGPMDEKEYLHTRLRGVRDQMLWKLEGLSDAAIRRPMTRSSTNLLGLVKHLTGGECNYLGETFGRQATYVRMPWWEPDNAQETLDTAADMYATPGESTEYIIDLYRRACAHADRTISDLDLDDVGTVPHTGELLTLRQAIVHTILETGHHAGHADIVRELIDGSIGGRGEAELVHTDHKTGRTWRSIPDEAWFQEHYKRVAASSEAAAQGCR
ncbi:DinB family protein [Actinopolymorpha pittospori]